jgi:hypothetical protein
VPLARTPKTATAPLSTRASDTFSAPASLVTEIRSGRRLAYPAGKGCKSIRWFVVNNMETGGLVQVVFPQSFADLATKASNS